MSYMCVVVLDVGSCEIINATPYGVQPQDDIVPVNHHTGQHLCTNDLVLEQYNHV